MEALKYPPIKPGKFSFGGGPGVGTHSHTAPPDNWQSDSAYDLMAAAGTQVVAVEDGVISDIGFFDNGRNVWGWKLYLNGDYYYTHLAKPFVKDGQRVKAGQVLGVVGDSPYWGDHLHIGSQRGDADIREVVYRKWPTKTPPKKLYQYAIRESKYIIARMKALRAQLKKEGH